MSSSVVRRLGIPECILLITQRITKYPVLLQRILQHTKGESLKKCVIIWALTSAYTVNNLWIGFEWNYNLGNLTVLYVCLYAENEEDFEDLTRALHLLKDIIASVDSKVDEHEKKRRLKDIYGRTDSKSITRMKSGQMFAREDLLRSGKLLHDGSLQLKNTAGRLKGKRHFSLWLLKAIGRSKKLRWGYELRPLHIYVTTNQAFSNLIENAFSDELLLSELIRIFVFLDVCVL